ncbi:hypothetical protein ACHAXA_000857 [Cyclostephanos tholiformis]|uniref:VWFA domain-containing protein n=1 Tax=Cyclostephanos tholiformis TaxID=382380 RepID=A0ABD3SQM0_9STRA
MMINLFPWIVQSGVQLFLAVGSLQLLASMASTDKESEVESIFLKLESDVRTFRDEIERAYNARCETKTLAECHKGNFNDCFSMYPNQQCLKADEFALSTTCGVGVSCNTLWDKTISKISFPGSQDNPSDSIIETICYSRLAEPFMVEKYKADEEYWGRYGVQPSATYFAAHNGLFRSIPAYHQEVCGAYDPRHRPYFVAASSGPKDVVLVLDVSGSMEDYGRMDIAKEAAITVVGTLTVADRFAVITFSSNASQLGGYTGLIRATIENQNQLVQAIKELKPQGGTNFNNAFANAFDALDETIRNEATSGCNIAILFMTDGQVSEGPGAVEVISLVNERTKQLEMNFSRKTTIFTFSLGKEADHTITKTIACNTGGIWTPVSDVYGDLISAMSAYYKLFALGLGVGGNEDFAAWVEPYKFYTRGVIGTTVSVPVYDRSVTPPLFLGVVAVGWDMSAIKQILGEEATSSTMLERFVARSTALCPKIELSACELDALRFLSGGEDATCAVCNTTDYAGIVPETCPFQSDLPKDPWDNADMAGKGYKEKACCEVGKNIPSDSCPAVHPSPIEKGNSDQIIIIVVTILAMMGVIFLLCFGKPHETNVQVPVAVPVGNNVNLASDNIDMMSSSKNASMAHPRASAPPASVNP